MKFGISTNWNSLRHERGGDLVEEALSLGFEALELGYNLTAQQAAEIKPFAERGEIAIDSVHAFCPVPMSAPYGYPEQHLLASTDEDERVMARIMIEKTLDFTAAMGAKAVVLHAGRIFLKSFFSAMSTHTLAQALEAAGGSEAPGYKKVLAKAVKRRSALAKRYYDGFCLSLDTMLPRFEELGITLALENLPSIEAFPDMDEMIQLKQRFDTPVLAYWHDIGHGQVREYFGWERHIDVAQALLPYTRGTHIHDALPLMDDHLPPGMGKVDFSRLSGYADARIIKVFEPARDVPAGEVGRSLQFLRSVWGG
ncbi:MAG: sugar phosphate isomerase/epimerase [Kiritimatiellae bacterium]|nr:sugar phosphate isomerase/epimerase [Kiritimatiellia bacterium]